MRKLLKLLSKYDNYLDEGAIFELDRIINNSGIEDTIVYEIRIPDIIKKIFNEERLVKCSNIDSGDAVGCDVYDLYMFMVFSKNVLIKDGKIYPSANDSKVILETLLNEIDYRYDCYVNVEALAVLESQLINYIKSKLSVLGSKSTNIVGIHNLYNNSLELDAYKDIVSIGYDRDHLLLIEFIPKTVVKITTSYNNGN